MAHATLIIEDGSIVAGANTYVSEADFVAWAADRNVTLTGEPDAALIEAMDYLESLDFVGRKVSKDQPLQWPRDGVVIDGFDYADDEIPKELISAQYFVALSIAEGVNPLSSVPRAVKRQKVGTLEIEYSDDAAQAAISRSITASLKKLLSPFGGLGTTKRW